MAEMDSRARRRRAAGLVGQGELRLRAHHRRRDRHPAGARADARAAGGGGHRPHRRGRRAVHHGGGARRVPARHAGERHDTGGVGRDRRGGRRRPRTRGASTGPTSPSPRVRPPRPAPRYGSKPRAPSRRRNGGSGVRRRHPAAAGLSLPRIPRLPASAPHAGRWCGCVPAKAGSGPPPRSRLAGRRGGLALRRRPLPGQRVRLVPADVAAARRHRRARPHGRRDPRTPPPRRPRRPTRCPRRRRCCGAAWGSGRSSWP